MPNSGSGPGYTVDDLVFYGMMFLGIIVTYKSIEEFAPDVHHIIRLIVGLIVGVGLGWVSLKLYHSGRGGGDGEM